MLRPPPARGPPAPVHPYRIRAPLRFAGRSAALPPTRCRLPQWVQAPGRTTPRPTVHCCQPLLAVLVGSGTGQVCSTPPHAPGRTRSDSIRSIRTPRLPVQPLAGSAGAVLRKPVLHSCPYFITKIIARTDGFLGRLRCKPSAQFLDRPRFLAACGFPKQLCRFFRAAFGEQRLVERLFELQASFRRARRIAGLSGFPFSCFVARGANSESRVLFPHIDRVGVSLASFCLWR